MALSEDSRLAKKAQKGDRSAFEALLVKYERPIFSFVWHFFQDRSTCEDVTQDTFMRAWRFIASFRTEDKFSTWLFSIAKNLCMDELRRRRKAGIVDLGEVDMDDIVNEKEGDDPFREAVRVQEGEILRSILVRLPEKQRTCLILFYFNELSYEDISKVMKISLANTKILLFRGKRAMMALYEKEAGNPL